MNPAPANATVQRYFVTVTNPTRRKKTQRVRLGDNSFEPRQGGKRGGLEPGRTVHPATTTRQAQHQYNPLRQVLQVAFVRGRIHPRPEKPRKYLRISGHSHQAVNLEQRGQRPILGASCAVPGGQQHHLNVCGQVVHHAHRYAMPCGKLSVTDAPCPVCSHGGFSLGACLVCDALGHDVSVCWCQ